MQENLNQEIQTSNDEGFFDDITEEDIVDKKLEDEEVETKQEVENEQEKVEESVPADSPFLNIIYNKENKALTRDEAIALAQKGMNYDNIYGRYQEVEKLAKRNGMEFNDYVKSLNDTQRSYEVEKEFNELSLKYPNSDEEVLKELATKNVEDKFKNQETKFLEEEKKKTDSQTEEISRQLDVFKKRYPMLDPSKLDNKVYDLMNEGYTLLESYSIYKDSEQAKKDSLESSKDKARELNDSNKRKTLGSTVNVGEVETDDFMSGWNSL